MRSASAPDVSLLDAVQHQIHNFQKRSITYQIVGDNLDLEIKVRHMNKDNKNNSMHFFNLAAFKDSVMGNELPDEQTLADVPMAFSLPSAKDLIKLKRGFVILWSRVIGSISAVFHS